MKKHKKVWTALLLAAVLGVTVFGGCGEKKPQLPVKTEEVQVRIPGMEGEVRLAYLSDLHIIAMSDQVSEADAATVEGRIGWAAYEGTSSAEQWPGWVDTLNGSGAQMILFGGDMVDFASEENLRILQSGMEGLKKPWMYIRADHDAEPFYLSGVSKEDSTSYQNRIGAQEDVFVSEFPDFVIVGWNNSTSKLTPAGMERIRGAADTGKPLILLTHVPIDPVADTSLSDASRAVFQDRALVWGFGDCYYKPDDSPEGAATRELLEMIYSPDSPFTEILCGHLHLTWDGMVSEHVHQHVFSAAFDRTMGIITVSGEETP